MQETTETLGRNWWAMLLRGLVAIGFAIASWARPGPTLAILLVLLGVYLIGDGVGALFGTTRAGRRDDSWLTACEGALGIALGIFTLVRPVKAMFVGVVVVAVWALCTGVLELIEAVRLRRHIPGEWMLALSGLVRLAFGILLLRRPGASALVLLWIAAGYAVIDGLLLIGLAVRFRPRRPERRHVGTGGITPQPV